MGTRHKIFVPNDTMGTRKETAILLVGTAREFGISQQDIASTHSGFYVTEALADLVFADEPEPEPEVSGNKTKKATNKTSGNRAGKNEQE